MSYCGAHRITEQRDTLGRSTGYTYAMNGIPQQQTTIGYGADGRIASAGFTHQGEHKDFIYSYLPGTHLLHTLTHPNGLTLTQSYDATRDLPTDMSYHRGDALVVQRAYTYDRLGRPTARNLARYGTQTSDTFGYNTRSESPRRLGGGLDKHEVFAPKGRKHPTAVRVIRQCRRHCPRQGASCREAAASQRRKGVGASQLGLVYYNYRHYNPAMGRWMGRDIIAESNDAALYEYCVVRFEILLVVNSPECILSNHSILYYPRSCNCTDFIEPNRHDLRIKHVKIPMSEDNVLIN